MVESQPSKLLVAGSIPVSRSNISNTLASPFNGLAPTTVRHCHHCSLFSSFFIAFLSAAGSGCRYSFSCTSTVCPAS